MKQKFQILLLLFVTSGFAQDSPAEKTTSENYLVKIISDLKKEDKVSDNPVVVINERVLNKEALDTLSISPFEIESLSVIQKDQPTLVEVYGEQSVNGVILIVRKPFKEKFNEDFKTNQDVLFLINGKPVGSPEINTLNPEEIEHIEVIKNEDSISKYTSGNVRGIIKVSLKKDR